MTSVAIRKPWFGIAANIVGGLAVIAAVLPLWVLPAIVPPPPIDKVVVDTAGKIKDRVVAKLKGAQYKEVERGFNWYRASAAAAASLGVIALILAATSFVRHEPRRYAVAAVALGLGAIVFQFSQLIAGLVVIAMFLFVLLSVFS